MNLSAHSPASRRTKRAVRSVRSLRASWGLSQRLPRWCAFDGRQSRALRHDTPALAGPTDRRTVSAVVRESPHLDLPRRENVSALNGDKARFQRQRKHKILHRMRIRELRKTLEIHKAAKEKLVQQHVGSAAGPVSAD
jgi:hypothetical protein